MSNDLISRKALLENLIEEIPLAENVHIFKDIIENQPTVFDKEKVIEELKGEIELCVTHPLFLGNYIKKNRAIEIVEKGGIE